MRKCVRCGTEMKDNCGIKVQGGGNGIVLTDNENKLFGGRMGTPGLPYVPIVETFQSILRILPN